MTTYKTASATFEVEPIEYLYDDGEPPAFTATLKTDKGEVLLFEWVDWLVGKDSPETDSNMHMNQREDIDALFDDETPWGEIHEAMKNEFSMRYR